MKTERIVTLITLFLFSIINIPFLYSYFTEAEECSSISENITYGQYILDADTGDIYYYPDGVTKFTDGIADDGYVYDSDGKQINTLTYIHDKYKNQMEKSEMIFDSHTEAALFMQYYGLNEGGKYPEGFYSSQKDGKDIMQISKIKEVAGEIEPEYTQFIKEKAGLIDKSLSKDEQIKQALNLTISSLTYSSAHSYATMRESVETGKGICYHFARVLKDILKEDGIKSEIIAGTYLKNGKYHSWVRAWNDETGKWTYLDPARSRAGGSLNTAKYLSEYKQVTVWGE